MEKIESSLHSNYLDRFKGPMHQTWVQFGQLLEALGEKGQNPLAIWVHYATNYPNKPDWPTLPWVNKDGVLIRNGSRPDELTSIYVMEWWADHVALCEGVDLYSIPRKR